MKKKFSFLVLLFFLIASMGFAQPYYVSTTGNDVTGTGTAGNPWATINHAISVVAAGNTIIVAAGTYSETVLINKALTLQGAKVGVDARSRSGPETIISSNNASGSIQIGPVAGTVTVDGFTVSGSPVKALHVTGATTTVIVRNNIFESATADGINLFRASNATVEYNWVKGAGTSGITAGDDNGTPSTLDDIITAATIRYNKVENSQYGITGYQTGSTISNNEVIGNATLGAGIGGQFYTTTISNNIVHGYTNGAGIAFNNPLSANRADSHDVTATQNKVYSNSAGIYVNQPLAGKNILVNRNNISGNTSYGAAMDVGASGTMDATYNWWGSVSGPSGVGPGTGDAVSSANFTYDPWYGKNVSPGLYSVGVSVVPNFTMTAAVTGTLQISSTTDFSSIVLSKSLVAASSYTFSNADLTGALSGMYQLSNSTTYYWRIYNTGTLTVVDPSTPPPPFENYYTFTTVTSAVPIVLPLTIVGNSVYITWYPNPFASNLKYDLMYSLNSNMSAATTVSSLTTTFYTLTGLTPGTNYYVQIRSKNSAETVIISYSAVNGFTTAGLPTPHLTYPTGGATVYSTTPTAYWYITAYYAGLQYQVRYATNSSVDGSGMLNDGSAVNLALTSNLYNTFPALTAGTTYYWQVRSYDGVSTYSSWSSVGSFLVYSSTPAIAPVPNTVWPVGGATSYINPPTLYWYLGTYATGLYFYVEWSSDGFATVAGNSGWFADNLYFAIPPALASGTYSWHVKSRVGLAGSVSAYSSTATFVIPSSSGSATVPTLTYPTGGTTVYVLNPTLYWYAYSTSSLEFQVRISTTSSVDGTGMLDNPLAVSSGSWTTSTSMAVSSIPYTLTAGAPYYWEVRSRLVSSPGVVSSWSSVGSFATAAGSLAIVPLTVTPNFGQPINNTAALLSWSLPVKSNSHLVYDVEYSKSSDFSNSTFVKDIPDNVTSVKGLDKNSTYYWRVLSKNAQGRSDYSQVASFNTGTVTAVEVTDKIPSEYELSQNYPNPFNPSTKITFTLPQSAFVTLKVYDMLGREVKTLISQDKNAGTYSIDWNADNDLGFKVASGMYVYRITAGNFVATKKMVLIK